MVELIIGDQKIDILDTSIKYVKQANDLADVTTVNSSYSYSITAPRTPMNTRAFEYLGIIGDTSDTPYRQNRTQLIDNGVSVLTNGISFVRETADNYKIVVKDGIIDFFRSIENKTLGKDLNLSELDHVKNDATIIASWTNPNYRYIISDYNGDTVKNFGINTDYQIPSVNKKYILDKIMNYAGYTYEGMPVISDEWITYPKPPSIPVDAPEESIFIGGVFGATEILYGSDWRQVYTPTWNYTYPIPAVGVTVINNWKLKVTDTGNYRAVWYIRGTMTYRMDVRVPFSASIDVVLPIKWIMFKNGIEQNSIIAGVDDPIDYLFSASQGDTIEFYPEVLTREEVEDFISGGLADQILDNIENNRYSIVEIKPNPFEFELFSRGVEYFDFGDAFKDFSLTDFMKELMFRKSLTPFPDVNEKHIVFKTLTERLNTAGAIDWSEKYGGRTNELYEFGSYAKVNALLMKHDDENDNYGNGSLIVGNDNIKDNQTLLQSKFYAPSEDLIKLSILTDEFFYKFKFWEREVKENEGVQTVEYKPLKNRFFTIKEQWIEKPIKIGETTSIRFPKATIVGTMMSDVVEENYQAWGRLFNGLRIHNIKLKLNAYHLATLRLDKVYYFDQEKAYYLLNKLVYESGKLSDGEFLKIHDISTPSEDNQNKPPNQLGDKTFTIPKGYEIVLVLDDFIDTNPPYQDPEGDAPEQIKITSFGDDLIKINNNGSEITSETIIDVDNMNLTIEDLGLSSIAHSASFDFKIQSFNNPNFSQGTGRIIVNVLAEVNVAPIADAGDDILIQVDPPLPGNPKYDLQFYLNGCDSYDPNNDIITYEWELMGEPSGVELLSDDMCNSEVKVLIQSGSDIITFQAKLTVEDPFGLSDTDTVDIKVTNLSNT